MRIINIILIDPFRIKKIKKIVGLWLPRIIQFHFLADAENIVGQQLYGNFPYTGRDKKISYGILRLLGP